MTYAELVLLIQGYLENEETSFVANIPLFVRLTEEDIYRQVQLPFLRKLDTSKTMTVGSEELTVPSDHLATYAIYFYETGVNIRTALINKEPDFMREIWPVPGETRVPRFYSQYDDTKIVMAPPPGKEYAVEWSYYYKPETLETASTNWLSQNGENALLYGALMHGYIYMKGDQDVVAGYKEKYQNAIADLKIIAEGRNRKDTYRTSDRRIPT